MKYNLFKLPNNLAVVHPSLVSPIKVENLKVFWDDLDEKSRKDWKTLEFHAFSGEIYEKGEIDFKSTPELVESKSEIK